MENNTISSEISWLSFNSSVLDEANDTSNPLYERIKFLAIHSSNLDKFFRVKLNKLLEGNSEKNTILLGQILSEVILLQNKFGIIWKDMIVPELTANEIILYENQEIIQQYLDEIEYYLKKHNSFINSGSLHF